MSMCRSNLTVKHEYNHLPAELISTIKSQHLAVSRYGMRIVPVGAQPASKFTYHLVSRKRGGLIAKGTGTSVFLEALSKSFANRKLLEPFLDTKA